MTQSAPPATVARSPAFQCAKRIDWRGLTTTRSEGKKCPRMATAYYSTHTFHSSQVPEEHPREQGLALTLTFPSGPPTTRKQLLHGGAVLRLSVEDCNPSLDLNIQLLAHSPAGDHHRRSTWAERAAASRASCVARIHAPPTGASQVLQKSAGGELDRAR